MTEIMPFPENNYETVLLDRPEWRGFSVFNRYWARANLDEAHFTAKTGPLLHSASVCAIIILSIS